MKQFLLSLSLIIGLTGCATDYERYYQARDKESAGHSAVAVAKAEAEKAKYEAIKELSAGSDATARVAGILALAMGGNTTQLAESTPQSTLAAPVNPGDRALAWAGLLVPTLVQAYGIGSNARIAIAQSNNSRDVALSTNSAFLGMGSQIQGNTTNTTNTTGATTTTDSHDANTTTNTTTSTDSHAVDNHAVDNHATNPPAQIPAGRVCSVDPATSILTCL